MNAPAPIPALIDVMILTGFLGSGKTTLLQRLLALPDLSDAAVLINEYGEVGLDHHLIRHIDENIVMLANGCVCCTVRDDLGAAIRDLLRRRAAGELNAFTRLVIETTGLADPAPILHTLMTDPVLGTALRVASIVTTVDAVNGTLHLARQPESVKQAALADFIVVTKTDLANDAAVAELSERLRHLNPSATLTTADAVAPRDLLGGSGYGPGGLEGIRAWLKDDSHGRVSGDERRVGQSHDARISSCVLELDEAIEWAAFGVWLTMLLHRHGENILRVKGMLNVRGASGPVVVHGVQHLVHPPVHLERWPDEERRSRVVFITRDIDVKALSASLSAFNRAARRLAADPETAGNWPVSAGAGAEIGGRPYRRRGGLAWSK